MYVLAITGVDPLVLVGVVLLGLLGALSWLSRRLRGTGLGSGREHVALTGQHAVHVVEIGGRRLLLGTGPSGAPRVLAELGEVEVAVPVVEAGGRGPWAELLDRLGGIGGR
jgi:hypothetical protein